MREKGKSEDNFLISFSDVLLICKQCRYKIAFWMGAFGSAVILFILINNPQYLAEATFREKAKTPTDTNKNMSLALIVGTQEGSENAAISLMKSKKLMEQVVRKRGLQAQIKKAGLSFSWMQNFWDNLKVEWAYLVNAATPALQDESLTISARDIAYADEVPKNLQVQFVSDNTFKIIDRKHQEEGAGQLGIPFIGSDYSFTLYRKNKGPLKEEKFNLTLHPMKTITEKLAKKILIILDTSDKTLLKLSYKDKNREEASAFLNTLMGAYLDYLKTEQMRITEEQVAYLNLRQDESSAKLKNMMEEHAHALSSNMATMESLFSTQQNYAQRLLVIDLELKRLKRAREAELAYYDRYADGVDPGVINQILGEIRLYKQQADSIDAALGKAHSDDTVAQSALFKGIDLATANQLYINYSKNLDEIEADVLHYQFIIGQMKEPDFEPSSLSSVLTDPVSQGIIVKACDLSLRLKDQFNRSPKELERIREDLDQQRNFLLMHIQQMHQLLKLREKLLKGKLLSVQIAQMELIHQKITLLEKHLSEYIDNRIHNFQQEKLTIEQQQLSLQKEMEKMPTKWASEKLIDQHLEMSRRMVEEITKLVESKNISTNLDITQSAPIDIAIPPLHPVRPQLILLGLLGSLLGGMLSVGFFVMRAAAKGIPATQKNLRLMKQNVVGVLSRPYRALPDEPLLDGDLDTLRRLTASITSDANDSKEGQSVLLMVSKGVDYSQYFASLLSKGGFKVIYLNVSFDHACTEPELPGLMQYIEGKSANCRISKGEGFDTISTGGISRFSNELAGSRKFLELIEKLKKEYDWIIVASKASPLSGEGDHLLNIFDYACVTVTEEFVQQLIPMIGRARQGRLSFIFTASKARPSLRNY